MVIIKEIYDHLTLLKRLERKVQNLQETIDALEIHNEHLQKRNLYKRIISQYPTAWYGHFEKALKICNLFEPKIIVDLGIDYGFSTFSFAFSRKGQVYGIDSFMGDDNAGFRDTYVKVNELNNRLRLEFNIENVHVIKGLFDDIEKKWDKSIDILHIDGLHTYDAVRNDYNTWKKHFNENTIVLFHDTISYKNDVGRYFNELEGHKLEFTDWNGLGVWSQNENSIRQLKYVYE